MYRTRQFRISKNNRLYGYCSDICRASAVLYNRANFIIRQYSSAMEAMASYKPLYPNQMQVFSLVKDILKETKYLGKGSWLSYNALDYLLKATKDRAYYGLPSQANQQILKLLLRDYRSFFEAVKAYSKNPAAFTGRPRMPGYVSEGKYKTAILTNQICRIRDDSSMRFPGTADTLRLGDSFPSGKLKEVRIKPHGKDFVIDVVMGHNVFQKQEADMGHISNQNFVQIPMLIFADMLRYKLAEYGIRFTLTEESYTSKADFLAMDEIPVYEKGKNTEHIFSGRRIKRGLYRHYDGTVTNADINGAANILRKVFPKVTRWDRGIVDMPCSLGCVKHPESSCRTAA